MDRARASEIAHGELALIDPIDPAQLDEVIAMLHLAPGARAIDIGCGRGEVLARVAEHWPGVRGTGVDLHAPYIEAARRRAAGLELTFHAEDAAEHVREDQAFDLAIAIGASHALGGDYRHGLFELHRLVRPGGQVLLGEGYWRQEPSPEYLQALGGATADELTDYSGLIGVAQEAGLTPLYATVSSERDWDRYEWALVHNAERWAERNPDDPFAPELLAWARAGRDRYVGPGGRDTLGFGLFLFRRG